jgi:hypothetical protein
MQVFDTPGPVTLRISIPDGDVNVEAAEGAQVTVDLQPLRNNNASRDAVEQARVELIERSGRYEVVVEGPKQWMWGLSLGRGASIGVRITCPEGTRIEASTTTAEVRTRGRLGEADIKTASADIELDVVDGEVRVATASGDVATGEIGGGSLKSASGDLGVRLARGRVSLNSASGDVRLDRALAAVSVATASGDQELGSVEAGEIKLQSVSGDVRVGVVSGLRVWLDATSVSGAVTSSLALEEGGRTSSDAVLELRARTVSGDIRIEAATLLSA